ncbi:molybdopterin-guanine dinucleotide biosynthesis protein MobB [Paenibacillus jamilae]|uniref:Molybdopterin-guanine dinucleotide biosynthesis protein MobB n=1 Tax=Paenibacillus jamilae TaxID=114136 RepID=A0ACC4ZWE8_9BACL|nr:MULTISPECIES: molybdopterin-guanine dinucleotide biosynthesis protein B [Paenibacillus]AJE53804.1 molybdopterin-guanine dinucleotide biosynthesis protein MobB [Paenibacillus polymyxa]AUO08635.1 molybdopterin-guanine dinucleotide biosynthesis protein B [Paenibacillus sp. lzh-N1]KTS82931.1 molybdopterin-guanine dinucleotide biosynthesis protein MobB [Paenibacillus jamilae]QOH62256.1 molybdopterin-guanine dinucleotide biosynthesis protein B [Paenibacillus polymyxa]
MKTKHPFVCQIVGFKNTGKTTFLGGLIRYVQQSGLRVAVIKHDGHEFEMDHEGTDTYKHRQAGAEGVAIVSAGRTAILEEQSRPVTGLIRHFQAYDCVLLEGFKQEKYPKLVMVREQSDARLVQELTNVQGVVVWECHMDWAQDYYSDEQTVQIYPADASDPAGRWLLEQIQRHRAGFQTEQG